VTRLPALRLLGLLGSLLWLSGCTSAPAGEQTSSASPTLSSVVAPRADDHHTPRALTPTRLRMPGVDAAVVPLVLDGTSLTPPADPQTLGWWGRRAGTTQGVTLLVGHTVHTGGGQLDHLEDVTVGSSVAVNAVAYRVTNNTIMSKSDLAADAAELFDQTGPHRLVVVTCEDYDAATGEYASNVVLTATPQQ
jgi:hypothetical protein